MGAMASLQAGAGTLKVYKSWRWVRRRVGRLAMGATDTPDARSYLDKVFKVGDGCFDVCKG